MPKKIRIIISFENGIRDKVIEKTATYFKNMFYHSNNNTYAKHNSKRYMILDEIKLAIGPYIMGITAGIVVFIAEIFLIIITHIIVIFIQ